VTRKRLSLNEKRSQKVARISEAYNQKLKVKILRTKPRVKDENSVSGL